MSPEDVTFFLKKNVSEKDIYGGKDTEKSGIITHFDALFYS